METNLRTTAFAHVTSNSGSSEEEIIRTLAYRLWEERGRPSGDPDQDWILAQNLYQQVKNEDSNTVDYPTSTDIRFRYRQGGVSQKSLAKDFGISLWEVRKALGTTGKTGSDREGSLLL